MQNKIAGIILAAGESSRMGKPKPLLEFADGTTLLTKQTETLRLAGCDPIAIVVGFKSETVIAAHLNLDVSWCINENWKMGQFVSLQTGISHVLNREIDAVIILPVDTAGVATATVKKLIDTAANNPRLSAIIPKYNDKNGHPIYLSKNFCDKIVTVDPSREDARLDLLLREMPDAVHISVTDKAVIMNINTPEEWSACSNEYSS